MLSARQRAPRVLAVASGGGHWVQLQRVRPAFDDLTPVFVGVSAIYRDDVRGFRFYAVRDVTRWDRFGLLVLAVQLVWILARIRPDVVVTTGSAPGLMAIAIAKYLIGSKTIWIDSIANIERMSMSGSKAKRFADVWLTQWPHLETPSGPSYLGSVL